MKHEKPDLTNSKIPFEMHVDKKKIKYFGYTSNSTYVRCKDGVKLAISYFLPKKTDHKKIPTILIMERYWRHPELKTLFKWLFGKNYTIHSFTKVYTGRGYALVIVDCRGTGASFGTRKYPFFEQESLDGNDILDWISSQPWSDGNVVTRGVSYPGTMAENVAALNHPALKAFIPIHCGFDPFLHAAYPGGCYNVGFLQRWENSSRYLDLNSSLTFKTEKQWLELLMVRGITPVASDKNRTQLIQAIKDHEENHYSHELCSSLPFRDSDLDGDRPYDVISTYSRLEAFKQKKTPIMNISSWYDSGYGESVINRFMNMENPGLYILGDWNHGIDSSANPFIKNKKNTLPTKNTKESELVLKNAYLNFYDQCLFGTGYSDKLLYYYTVGEEVWKTTNTWPPKNQILQKWFFNENNTLSQKKPKENAGEDEYKVNFKTTTKYERNRWWTLLGYPIDFSGREQQDALSLLYTSEPMENDVEITGNAIITLFLKSTHEDGALFIYLEDVDPENNVTYITEGQFRVIHRKISGEQPPYVTCVPYHSFKEKDILPLVLNEVAEIKFGLLSISALIRKNHRIRVSIAGADKASFERCPSTGNPILNVMRNSEFASMIELPIITSEKK